MTIGGVGAIHINSRSRGCHTLYQSFAMILNGEACPPIILPVCPWYIGSGTGPTQFYLPLGE